MKNKKSEIVCTALLILGIFLLGLISCSESDVSKTDFQFVPEEQDYLAVKLDNYYFDFCTWEERIYLLGSEHIGVFDGTGDCVQPFADVNGDAIAVYDGQIAVLAKDEIIIFDKAGSKVKTYPLNTENIGRYNCIEMNRDWIVFGGLDDRYEFMRERIFCLNRNNGEIVECTAINASKTVFAVYDMALIDADIIAVSAKITLDFFTQDNILITYDIKNQNIIDEINVPYISDLAFSDNAVYLSKDARLCRYIIEDDNMATIRNYRQDLMENETAQKIIVVDRKIEVTSENILLLYPTSMVLYIDRLNYKESPVKILAPESQRVCDRYEDELLYFTMETKIPVEVEELSDLNYQEKLNLRLISKEDNFDLFFLDKITHSHILKEILEKNLYHSLDEYAVIEAIYSTMYDGIRDMMTYDGSLYGMPVEFACIPLLMNREVFEKYGIDIPGENWTFDDVWELCERLMQESADVRIFSNDLQTLATFLTIWGEHDSSDTEGLTALLKNFRKYMEYGVLAFENGDSSKYNYNYDKDYLFQPFHEYIIPYFDDDTAELFRWPVVSQGDAALCKLSSAILMNKQAQNGESAAKLMCYLYQSEAFKRYYSKNENPAYVKALRNCKPVYIMNNTVMTKALSEPLASIYDKKVSVDDIGRQILEIIHYTLNG